VPSWWVTGCNGYCNTYSDGQRERWFSQGVGCYLPDSPTTTEVGVPFVASNWIGLTAPKGTPREAIEWAQKHFNAAVATPYVAARFAEQGVQPTAMSTSEFSSFMQQETNRWGDVIRSAKIKAQP
jgi:tripartite-type tricarboxylate transporter receptor subunit TctC